MVAPISSLANMEMKLYGGQSFSSKAPSYLNGYNMSSIHNSIYSQQPFNIYHNSMNNPAFRQSIPKEYYLTPSAQNAITQQNVQVSQSANSSQVSAFQGLTKKETDAIVNYYAKGLSPMETLLGAAGGQAVFSIINHPRILAHTFNTLGATKYMSKLFAPVKDATTSIGKLWADKSTNNLVREFYFQTNKAISRRGWKLGLFRQTFAGEDLKEVNKLLIEAKKLINNPNTTAEQVADITARLKHSYIDNGKIKQGWNWVKKTLSGGKIDVKLPTVGEALANKEAIQATKDSLLKKAPTDFKGFLKSGQGIGGAVLWLGMELLLNYGKIKTAFKNDSENDQKGISTNNGWKQLGQTIFKGLGSATGWAIGEAAGAAAFTAYGAKLGTLFGPGIGTAIGAIAGFVGGGIGMWLTGKLSRAIVGQDVADKIEADNLSKTQEGQAQLLQYTVQQMQDGKKVPYDAQLALQKIATQMA